MPLIRRKVTVTKSEKRIRIESLLQAGEPIADIAKSEGLSRQRIHQIKLQAGMQEPRIGAYSRIPRPRQGWKRRPSRAFAEWLAAQQQESTGA